MRIVLVFILGMLGSTSLIAQTKRHYIQPNFNNFGAELQVVDGQVRMLTYGYHQNWFGSASLYASTFDQFGNHVHTSGIGGFFGERIHDFLTLELPDGEVAVLADLTGCDFGIRPQLGLVGANNQPKWVIETGLETDFFGVDIGLHLVEGGFLLVSDGENDLYYDMSGNQVQLPDTPKLHTHHTILEDGYLSSRDATMYRLNDSVQVTDSIQLSGIVQDIDTLSKHSYAILSTDSVFITNATLDVIASFATPGNAAHQVISDDALWLIGNMVWRLDTMFQLQDSFQIEVPGTSTIIDALHLGNRIFVSGEVSGYNLASFCLSTPVSNPSFQISQDVELADIIFTDTVRYVAPGSPFTHYRIDYGPVYVSLVNHGPEMLQAVTIRYTARQCEGICEGHYQLMWHLNGLTIAPGDTASVFVDDLVLGCAYLPPGEFCLWATGPNDQPDANIANDLLCVNIDNITSTRTPIEYQIVVYPNPASGQFTVQLNDSWSGETTITLIDLFGQTVLRKRLGGQTNTVNVSDVQAGVYYVVIKGKERFIRKIVITGVN